MKDLKCYDVLVTGTSGRLGPIWVDTLEDHGARVWGIDKDTCDVTNQSDINKYTFLMERNGFRPNVLINNAAIDNPPGSDATFWGNLDDIIAVNLIGAAKMSAAVIPLMIERGGGVIINIGSIMGETGANWTAYPEGFEKPIAYNLSKAGMIQMSRSITTQYGRYNVRGVTIAFGPVDIGLSEDFKGKFLERVPLGRMISEQSLRAALIFAITCPELAGARVLVDAGYTSW